MNIFTVAIWEKEDRDPWITSFDSEEKADAFIRAAKYLISKDKNSDLIVTKDSGTNNSANYLKELAENLDLTDEDLKKAMEIYTGEKSKTADCNKFYVGYAIDARFEAEVCVPKDVTPPPKDAPAEMREKFISLVQEEADNEYYGADFGVLSDVVGNKTVYIQNEKGDFIWEDGHYYGEK